MCFLFVEYSLLRFLRVTLEIQKTIENGLFAANFLSTYQKWGIAHNAWLCLMGFLLRFYCYSSLLMGNFTDLN